MKKIFAALIAGFMSVSMLASCGDSDNNTSGDKKETTPATKVIDIDLTQEEYAFGVDKAQPELLKQVNDFIKEIKDNGKFDEVCNKYFSDGTPTPVKSAKLDDSKDQLVVATNASFEPFEYKDGENYLGVDMEIASLLAEKLGKELVVQNMDFDAVCLSVGQHKCDLAMAGLTIKEERKEYVDFSDAYYQASQRIVVKGDDKTFDSCKTSDDVAKILNEKDSSTKIGVQNGTTGQKFVQGDKEWEFDGFKVTCTGYKNGSLAVQDMVNGNIDYVIIDSAPAQCISTAINKLS